MSDTPQTVATAPPSTPAEPAQVQSTRSRLAHYYLLHLLGAALPLTAALALYGWRALGVVGLLVGSVLAAVAVWRRIGARGALLGRGQAVWLAVLLALMLPAHLLAERIPGTPQAGVWLLLPAAGLLLVILMWLLGGLGHWHLHPLLLTYLILVIACGDLLSPRLVLHRQRAVVGDLIHHAPPLAAAGAGDEAWIYARGKPESDAILLRRTASHWLTDYTRGQSAAHRAWVSVDALLRDAMPPLEDLVVGGHPGPIGASSAIAVLIGGLFLLYKRLLDFRIPLLVIAVAYFAFLLLPVPVAITESGTQWRPLVMPRANIDLGTIITFANYQVMASPLLLVAFFLAPVGGISPMRRNGKRVYAVALGLLAAACQLYISCAVGPYIALVAAAMLTPWLDAKPLRQQPVVVEQSARSE